MKKGDQILEVNGQSFEHVTKYSRALEILIGVCHLSITVKSNLLAFQDMLQTSDDTPRSNRNNRNKVPNNMILDTVDKSLTSVDSFCNSSRDGIPPHIKGGKKETLGVSVVSGGSGGGRFIALSSRHLLNRALHKFLHKPKSINSHDTGAINEISLVDGSTCKSSSAMFPVNNLASNADGSTWSMSSKCSNLTRPASTCLSTRKPQRMRW